MVIRDLPFAGPLWPDSLYGHLAATGIPGVEEWRDGAYRRTLRLPGGPGVVTLPLPHDGVVAAQLRLTDPADEAVAVQQCRRILDLDADPVAIDAVLQQDDVLAPLVDAAPGRRVPGAPDGAELLVRAVIGQQVSTAAARTHAARLVAAFGDPVDDPDGGLTHLFPSATALAGIDPATLAMPATRRATLVGVAQALAADAVDPGSYDELVALPGIGPWTANTVVMRAFGDGDAFLPTDLGVVLAAKRLGLPHTPGALTRRAETWRPYRAYAVQHLWATGEHAVNSLPS